ncbi:MAG: hypothetical protein EXR75_08525 [Myxococcales bacterium]|nr:hypothetical protein [Myxococcales bacterium]
MAANVACRADDPGAAETVADRFADAYFVRADLAGAARDAALGMARTLEQEVLDTRALRAQGYGPSQANLNVRVERRGRSERGERIRFDYAVTFGPSERAGKKHADVELARLDGSWKVVRVGLVESPPTR